MAIKISEETSIQGKIHTKENAREHRHSKQTIEKDEKRTQNNVWNKSTK